MPMNNEYTFLNQNYVGIILSFALILLVCFIWKEWKDKERKRFLIRILTSFITILSLVFIALKPAYKKEITVGEAVILTKGYQTDKLDSLKKKNKKLTILKYDSNSNIVRDLDSITSAIVLGYGIETYDLWQFSEIPTTYFSPKKPDGISKLSYQKTASIGSKITIHGEYINPKKENHLVLADPGGNVLDSIMFTSDSVQKFELKSDLKIAGNLVYKLIEKDSTGYIQSIEQLPITVSDKKPLRILMLNNFPTFETKYLKNFLATRGHELITRSQLTKDRYKFEYYNMDRTPIYGLTENVLTNFDVLIIDADYYMSLSLSTKNSLKNVIESQGLGVFIQPNDTYFKLTETQSFFKFLRDDKNEMIIEDDSKTILEKYPYDFESSISVMPINMNLNIKIGVSKFIGLGKVATTNVINTYQLLLDGKQDVYTGFWTDMLDEISKKQQIGTAWEAMSEFPIVDVPFEFNLRTEIPKPEVSNQNGSQIALLQDVFVPAKWQGIEYPINEGWNELKIKNDTTADFFYYVFDSTQRIALNDQLKIDANSRYFESKESKNSNRISFNAISPIWFYIIFLLGIGYLWLEPKL